MATDTKDVEFEDGAIPESKPLPSYRMIASPPPDALVESLLAGELPASRPDSGKTNSSADKKPVYGAAFRQDKNGFEIYPSLQLLAQSPARPLAARAILREARDKLLTSVVPPDGITTATVHEGRLLSRARRDLAAPEAVARTSHVLLYVSVRRRVGDLPIDGPGSRIMVALDAERKVHGAVYDWNRPEKVDTVTVSAPDPDKVRAAIVAQLRAAKPRNGVRVKRIELAYYDSGVRLHPVYRYVAEFGQDAKSCGAPDVTVGYVPFEPHGDLPPHRGGAGAALEDAKPLSDAGGGHGKIRVGRYIGRDLSLGWTESSTAFWNALREAPHGSFTEAQAGHARPAAFAAEKGSFVDAVDVALLEAHGFDMGFVLRGDSGDPVFIERDISPRGYGHGVGGRLKHWILHSCTAVGTEAEYPKWGKHWGGVFRGLSSVVGYRSVMFVSDGAPAALGVSLAAGAPVASAWINAVTSLNIYARDSEVRLRCAGARTLGRPSAIVPVGHGDAPADVAGPEKPRGLECWWIEDATVTTHECPEMGPGGPANYAERTPQVS